MLEARNYLHNSAAVQSTSISWRVSSYMCLVIWICGYSPGDNPYLPGSGSQGGLCSWVAREYDNQRDRSWQATTSQQRQNTETYPYPYCETGLLAWDKSGTHVGATEMLSGNAPWCSLSPQLQLTNISQKGAYT